MTSEVTQAALERAASETERLRSELDVTNADHIALWIEANLIPDEPMSQCVSWFACRIAEAHERAIAGKSPEPGPSEDRDQQVGRIMNENAEYMNGVDRGQVRFGYSAVVSMIDAAIAETEARHRLTAQSGEGRSGAGEDVGPFHVSQSGDGKKLWFSARDPASGVTIPARDRTDARNLVSSLNRACATFAALNARQSGEGEREDWVAHDGGDCPVDPAATVEIKLRDGSVTTMTAKAVNWRYGTYIFEAHRTMPAFCEVVAYRLRAGEA